MSYPVLEYLKDGQWQNMDDVQYKLDVLFRTTEGKKLLDLLVNHYFGLTAEAENDLWRLDGVRRFIQMIKDTRLILDNCQHRNIEGVINE